MNRDFAIGYLSAIIDGEGHVGFRRDHNGTVVCRTVNVSNTDYSIIEATMGACQALEIRSWITTHPGRRGRKLSWRVEVAGNAAQYKRLADTVVLCPRKRETLALMISSYKRSRAPQPIELQKMYHEEMLSQQQIADRLGVPRPTVESWMKKYGIESRPGAEYRVLAWNRRRRAAAD